MSRAAELLARHAGHHLEPVDAERTRCLTCHHTLLVKAGRTVLTDQDRPAHTASAPAQPCPLHVGERVGTCRCCRADQLARPDTDTQPQPIPMQTADVARWVAACRAALPERKARR